MSKKYGKMYGKCIYLYVGESDTCVCEGITGKMASGRVGGFVCERHIVELHLNLFLYFWLENHGEEGIYEGGMWIRERAHQCACVCVCWGFVWCICMYYLQVLGLPGHIPFPSLPDLLKSSVPASFSLRKYFLACIPLSLFHDLYHSPLCCPFSQVTCTL